MLFHQGPGNPDDYPILNEVLEQFYQRVPILGVCLGFQCIVSYFGGNIIHGYHPVRTYYSYAIPMKVFSGTAQNFNVMRYHIHCC